MEITLQTKAPKVVADNIAKLQELIDSQQSFLDENGGDIPDCQTKEGLKLAKERRAAYRARRLLVNELHTAAKSFYLENGRQVDSAKNHLINALVPIEDSLKAAIAAEQTRKERIAQAAREEEQARVDAIKALLMEIRNSITASNVEAINAEIEKLSNLDLQKFQEYAEDAETEAAAALSVLETRKNELEAQEAEKARLEAQRLEQERIAKEQAEKQRAIDEENERLANEKAAEEKRKADKAAEAERQRIAKEAAEKANKEAAAQAEAARIKAEEARRAAVRQAEIDTANRIRREQEEADAKALAEKTERERLAAMAPDADKLKIWAASIADVPAMTSDEGKAAAIAIQSALDDMNDIVQSVQNEAGIAA